MTPTQTTALECIKLLKAAIAEANSGEKSCLKDTIEGMQNDFDLDECSECYRSFPMDSLTVSGGTIICQTCLELAADRHESWAKEILAEQEGPSEMVRSIKFINNESLFGNKE